MDAPTAKEQAVKAGDVVEGRYRVIKAIGEGGMGTVFLAEHTLIKRKVAIKVLHPELAADAKVVERFMNEARAAGTLGHSNIVESTDMGFLDGKVPYIVFEYLEGTPLTDEIYRVGGMSARRAVKIAQQLSSALQAAHAAGIIHRDLKSDNVFLTDRNDALDHVKVLDFGISKFLEGGDAQTRRGMIMGTPEFMAPEQISDPDNVDARVDVYALGVILYEMLAGRRPFTNDDPRTLLHRIMHQEPPPMDRPEIPRGLTDVVLALLAKDPRARYQTMADVETALSQYATGGDVARPGKRKVAQASPTAHTELNVDVPAELRTPTNPQAMRAPTNPQAMHASTNPNAQSPAAAVNTPWPGASARIPTPWPDAADGTQHIPQARRHPVALYALVGVAVVLGGAGLLYGMRDRGHERPPTVVAAPAPTPAPAAALPPAEPVAPAKVAITIDADVDGARVTFRRRVSPAPATTEVAPTDIVELVEVSAPGYKTVRYWLTMDRPTRLNAVLPKGTGLVEASEEETLIALGEVDAAPAPVDVPVPTSVATTPTPAAATLPTVVASVTTSRSAPAPTPSAASLLARVGGSARETPVPTPRKIGRAAADSEDAPPTSTSSPGSSLTRAATVDSPAKEPAKPVTPAAAVEKPVATAPTRAVVAPTARPAAPDVLDRSVVSQVAGSHRAEVMKCFADGRKADRTLSGSITVTMVVSPSGAVVRNQVQSTLGAPAVAACVIKSVKAWRFPARTASGNANGSYTFTLK